MKSEWWYDDSFVDYESLGVRDQELFLARLTVHEDGTTELLFQTGTRKVFPNEEDALLWLGDEEFRRLNGLIQDLVEDKRSVAEQIVPPSGSSENDLLPKMHIILCAK